MTDGRTRVLLINYDFPPGLSGVRRIVKLARYLPQFGYEPLVLCANPDGRMPLDYDALADVTAQGYPIIRTPSLDAYHGIEILKELPRTAKRVLSALEQQPKNTPRPFPKDQYRAPGKLRRFIARAGQSMNNIFALPDDRVGWLAFAIPAAEHLVKSQSIRNIITSSYPHSTHLIGLYLKRRYRVNWIADFRDGWSQNPYFANYATPLHRRTSLQLEQKVARDADVITTVSQPIAQHLETLTDPEKVFVIPNGFDNADFQDLAPLEFDRFTLAYTGSLFLQRSPENFFAAVRGLLDTYPGLTENFQVIFRTKFKPEHEEAIQALNLKHVIQNWGLGKYRDALRLQASADVLLVIEGEGPNAEIMLTQKVFEYLAAGKPILAISPPDTALAQLVRRSGSGIVVSPENIFRIKETLFELFLGRMRFKRDEAFINTFDRRRQAEQFASIMRRMNAPH